MEPNTTTLFAVHFKYHVLISYFQISFIKFLLSGFNISRFNCKAHEKGAFTGFRVTLEEYAWLDYCTTFQVLYRLYVYLICRSEWSSSSPAVLPLVSGQSYTVPTSIRSLSTTNTLRSITPKSLLRKCLSQSLSL